MVHGDFRLDNIVFESPVGPGPADTGKDKAKPKPSPGRGVLAVLDWELSTLGSPYGDVAYCCMPYHLPPASSSSQSAGAPAAYPAFAGSNPPAGVPTEAEFVQRWCVASGLPNPRTRTERVAGDPRGAKKPVWPFYVALSLFRGAAILAGVRARAAMGNASAANAREAGGLVETLAARALVVAGVPVGSIPRPVSSGASGDANGNANGGGADVGLTFVRGMEPSERAASLLVKLRAFMSDHVYPAGEFILIFVWTISLTWFFSNRAHPRGARRERPAMGSSPQSRGAQGAGESGGTLEPVASTRLGSVAEDRAGPARDGRIRS